MKNYSDENYHELALEGLFLSLCLLMLEEFASILTGREYFIVETILFVLFLYVALKLGS